MMEIISIEDLHPAVLSGASFGNPALLVFRTRLCVPQLLEVCLYREEIYFCNLKSEDDSAWMMSASLMPTVFGGSAIGQKRSEEMKNISYVNFFMSNESGKNVG
jgi:hypothetical protein